MRVRLALLGALLTACAARAPLLVLPAPSLPLADDPPPLRAAPAAGPYDSASSRRLSLLVFAHGHAFALEGWCRTGVWTTMQRLRHAEFTTREAWGRLGDRPPRRLTRVTDEAWSGVQARLRPNDDGSVSFLVELATLELGPGETVGIYHGERVVLPAVRRHGLRFSGRAPPGWRGGVARWGAAVHVLLGGGDVANGPPGARGFTAPDGAAGYVAGDGGAETFVEEWRAAEPIAIVADGVDRTDFRLAKHRRAAGFRDDGHGGVAVYGAAFTVDGDA